MFAFLDDVYVAETREKAKDAFQVVAGEIEAHAGVKTHLGKLSAWSRRSGPAPADIAHLGATVWIANNPAAENGIMVLGTPVGHPEYIAAQGKERMQTEQQLLDKLRQMDDPTCAWPVLLWSAVPRANHILRNVHPELCASYAEAHDQAIWDCFCSLAGAESESSEWLAKRIASMPGSLGGLGLISAARTSRPAYWAAWVDTLPVLAKRLPTFTGRILDGFRGRGPATPSATAAATIRDTLVAHGARDIPSWDEAAAGAEAPAQTVDEEDFEADDVAFDLGFQRRWQRHACSILEPIRREQHVFPNCIRS